MKKIELDVDLSKSPGEPMSLSTGEYFPEIHFEESHPCPIPESGLLTVSFRLIKHSEDSRNEDNKKYGYTIQVLKLISAEGEKDKSPARNYSEGGDALDALVAAKSEEKDDEY